MKYPTLLFDFDGVLAKTEEVFLEALNFSLKTLKEPTVSFEDFKKYSKYELLQQRKYSFVKLTLLILLARLYMKKNMFRVKLHQSVIEVVKSSTQKKFIISSNTKRNIKKTLGKENILFEKIYHAKGLMGKEVILKQFTKKSLYITDEVRDILECKKIGITVAAVTWGFDSPETLSAAQPNYLIKTPQELKAIINLENE